MFPLQSFLVSLESDGIRLTTRDYNRISCVLSKGGDWTLGRLRDVLLSLLAKDEDQIDLVGKRFDNYFANDLGNEEETEALDVEAVLGELRGYDPPRKPTRKTRFSSLRLDNTDKQIKKRFLQRRWLLISIAAVGAAVLWWIFQPSKSLEPILGLSPPAKPLSASPGEEDVRAYKLSNTGDGEIRVAKLSISFDEQGVFNIDPGDCEEAVLKDNDCQVRISFLPQSTGSKQATLQVKTGIGINSFPINALATERQTRPGLGLDDLPVEPVYPQLPSISDIKIVPIDNPDAWRMPAMGAGLFFLLTLGFASFLWNYRLPPKDPAPDWDSKLPRHFPLEKVGGKPAPRLDDETLAHLADSMGYFQSEQSSHHPDINSSVLATVAQGGIPSLVFQQRKQLRHLIVLVDGLSSEVGQTNPVAEELRHGMERLGVSLLFGRFFGDPTLFYPEDGHTCYLEDLEANRKAYLLLIFSEGQGLRDIKGRYALEGLARWPQVAWMNPCSNRYSCTVSALPAEAGIPQYPATADGLLLAFAHFLTERAPQFSGEAPGVDFGMPPQGNLPLGVYLETLLGDSLPWAQACAMVQPVTLGLADKLRREFYAHLSPEKIEHIISLPGTGKSAAGLRFSHEVLAELRRGFTQRQDDAAQEDILKAILHELKQTWDAELKSNSKLKDSPAQLAWQRHYERIRLELDPDTAIKSLSILAQSPLGNAVKADLEAAVLPGSTRPGVPLRKQPQSRDARQRLGLLAKNSGISPLDKYPLAWWHGSVLGLLLLITSGFTLWSLVALIQAEPVKAEIKVSSEQVIRAGVALQAQKGGEWVTVRDRVGLPFSNRIDPGGEYRLAFFQDRDLPIQTLDLGKIQQHREVIITLEPAETMSSATGKLVVTNSRRQVLHNARIKVRNGMFAQTTSATRTLELPVGAWEVKVETAQGIGSAWQRVEVLAGKKATLELSALYFRDALKAAEGMGPVMVPVPAGSFTMGDLAGSGESDEQPAHDIRLHAFAMGQYEVTFEEYDAFCEASGRAKPNDEGWGRGRQPVINVSWEDANAYAAWLSEQTGSHYRLPTEAEWEYVARAGSKTPYWWGEQASHDSMNYGAEKCCNGLAKGKDWWVYSAPVGSFPANAFGVFDTSGNVWEWVGDRYASDYYAGSPKDNPLGPEKGSGRVIRGGGWSSAAGDARSAGRSGFGPGDRSSYLGFRLARTVTLPFYPVTLGPLSQAQALKQKTQDPTPYKPFNDSLKDGTKAPNLLFIPGGVFKMGDTQDAGNADEKPAHEVTISDFVIGQYEVTVGEFRRFVEDAGYKTQTETEGGCWIWQEGAFKQRDGADWRDPGFAQTDGHPVACVSWHDALAYAQWLSAQTGEAYRLLTEAEWEYAARAGSETAYHFGDDAKQLDDYAWYNTNSDLQAHPVGKKKANKWGLHDMHGNLWEWVGDWYASDYYASSPKENPQGPEKGSFRVFRGGSWLDTARSARSAFRDRGDPGNRDNDLGFRLARKP